MTTLDLKVCQNLLDLKFEGYKLSLDSISILQQPIREGVLPFQPDYNEYSFMQALMSSNFNQLFQDPWNPGSIFFVDRNFSICWYMLLESGRLSPCRIVFRLPIEESPPKGNVSLAFPSEEWAVVSNGNGTVYILNAASRTAGEPWTPCHIHNIEVSSSCYLMDASHLSSSNKQQIDVVVLHFTQSIETADHDHDSEAILGQLDWLTFSSGQDLEKWALKRTRTLTGSSPLLYVALDKGCDALYVASENEYRFTYDSELPVVQKEKVENKDVETTPLYSYSQTLEDITVVFRLPENTSSKEISVNFESSHIDVVVRGTSVLKGELPHTIECSSCTWSVIQERLELMISKSEKGLRWLELVKGDKRGEELMDENLEDQIHSHLAYVTSLGESNGTPYTMSEMEDCDSSLDIVTFLRISGDTHESTHMVQLGNHQWLFTVRSSPNCLPVFCLRHDVDGLVWQPKNTSCDGDIDVFKVEHAATFSALGYVQASKQDKKFSACTPNFQYAIISDCARHVYLYCQPETLHSALELRNRKTGATVSHVAKQHVINLENCQEILGLQTCNDCIFVLSSKMLYAIKICSK